MENAQDSLNEIRPTRWRWNSKRILVVLVCLQLLAAPGFLIDKLIPPVIGFGSFSVSVDFRYAQAFLQGVSFSLPVFLAFLFAWSRYSLARRVLFIVPLIVLTIVAAVVSIFLTMFYLAMARGMAGPNSFPFHECCLLIGVLSFLVAGIALVPVAIRAYRGWRVDQVRVDDRSIDRIERRLEWLGFVAIAGFVCLSGSFGVEVDGMGVIGAMIGIVAGGVFSISAFWMLRDLKTAIVWLLFLVHAFLLVVLPFVLMLLAQSRRIPELAGYELVFVGVSAAGAVLMLQLFLVRSMGCRMLKFEFEKSPVVKAVEKVVVDPFSD